MVYVSDVNNGRASGSGWGGMGGGFYRAAGSAASGSTGRWVAVGAVPQPMVVAGASGAPLRRELSNKMVVGNANVAEEKTMDSQTLKFGMDRILSEETSSSVKRLEASCASAPPCVGCISSLFRCCRSSPALANADVYGSALRVPQPLRPYANVVIPGDSGVQPHQQPSNGSGSKRKRSWSRAVFSNLQRKGLEKRFQLQKYITKPDRRQLAATLGLTDAQVKVWFQNRRMKWRHTKELPKQIRATTDSEENILVTADSTQIQNTDSECESDIDVQTVDG